MLGHIYNMNGLPRALLAWAVVWRRAAFTISPVDCEVDYEAGMVR